MQTAFDHAVQRQELERTLVGQHVVPSCAKEVTVRANRTGAGGERVRPISAAHLGHCSTGM